MSRAVIAVGYIPLALSREMGCNWDRQGDGMDTFIPLRVVYGNLEGNVFREEPLFTVIYAIQGLSRAKPSHRDLLNYCMI